MTDGGTASPAAAGPGAPWAVEVDGRPVGTAELTVAALSGDGHYTAMQVRGARVRGLAAHLGRTAAAHEEVFGRPLPDDLLLEPVRRLGARHPDCYLRVTFLRVDDDVSTVAVVRPPIEAPREPQRLTAVDYVRPLAHLKHLGTFGQHHHARAARSRGADDALFVDPEGHVLETSIATLGLVEGAHVVWPDGETLPGITRTLLEQALPGIGVGSSRRRVRLDDLARYDAAFVANSIGVVPVATVDDVALDPAHRTLAAVVATYHALPWDAVPHG